MSIIKNALDKSVEQNRDRESLRKNYSRIREYQSKSGSQSSNPSRDKPNLNSGILSRKKDLLIVTIVILSLAVIGEILFALIYFL